MRLNPAARKKAEAEAAAAAAAAIAAGKKPPKRKSVPFTSELGERICQYVADGESMQRISKRPDMPRANTIFAWIQGKPDLREQYFLAKRLLKDRLVDEIIALADDASRDIVPLKNEKGESREVLNAISVQRTRTQIAVRQWVLTSLMPKGRNKYEVGIAEKPQVTANPPAGTVQTEERRLELIARRRAAIEAQMKARGDVSAPGV